MTSEKLILSYSVLAIAIACYLARSKSAPAMSAERSAQKQLSAAQHRWPGTTRALLDSGAIIYRTKCTRCHGNYEPTQFSESRWHYELSRMTSLAKLAPDEEVQVIRYILSLRETEIAQQH